VHKGLEEYANWLRSQKLIESVFCLAQNRTGTATDHDRIRAEARRLVTVMAAVPPELERAGIGKIEGMDPRSETEHTIAILCSNTHEAWGPKADGIGGSERMVRIMAPALQRRGINVTVYANVPRDQRGVDQDEVLWRHFAEYDEDRKRDVVIVWRGAGLAKQLQGPNRPRKVVYWGHDVQNSETWTNELIDCYDEIWLLSQYHTTTLSDEIREKMGAKLWITRNALDDRLWLAGSSTLKERMPNRVVYCSSPDRGVLTAIKAFQAAFRNDPHAQLHIGYGFTKMFWSIAADFPYRLVPDVNRTVSYYDYARIVRAAVTADPRIVFHGRVSWLDLIDLMRSSAVWLYPTRFPEISCMSAMEAQAAGMKIVATNFAALTETIDWSAPGVFGCTPESAADALAVAVDDNVTPAQLESNAKRARIRFSSEALADEWSKRLTT
jgi:glycosyltransferase involved in cell wall biosynthesis